MITLGQIMLYVEDQTKIADFWVNNLGFKITEKKLNCHVPLIAISDGRENGTEIVLHDKNLIASMQPELNLSTPSILLSISQDIELLYEQFKAKDITVGELVTLPTGQKVFNFADPENNYFAITQRT